jgi:DNA-3-methyladenine glycosylase II
VRAIIGQQVSVAGATTTLGKIVAAYGTPAPGLEALGLRVRFPGPDVLAGADLPIPGQRARAVRAFSAAVAGGNVALDGAIPLDELERQLCSLPGIGPWTAQYLALRLGYADAFPASDLVVRKALAATSAREAEQASEAWRPWRSYATVRLWSRPTTTVTTPSES